MTPKMKKKKNTKVRHDVIFGRHEGKSLDKVCFSIKFGSGVIKLLLYVGFLRKN